MQRPALNPLPVAGPVRAQAWPGASARSGRTRIACSRLVACAVTGLVLISASIAAEQRSPFVPDGFGNTAAPPPQASSVDRYEFRGVSTIVSDTFIILVDTSSQRTLSLAVGETVDGVRVTDYRSDDGSVQVEAGGQSKRLKLQEPKIVAMAAPPPQPMAPQNGPLAQNPPQGVPPAVAGAPISDEEARLRMQRVAEEIRRRREMRRQMLENQQQQPRPAQ